MAINISNNNKIRYIGENGDKTTNSKINNETNEEVSIFNINNKEEESSSIIINQNSSFFEYIKELFGKKENGDNSQDGEIGYSKQRQTGDCWLLSGINAISYSEEGKKIIKDALDYQENGDIIVHLKGIGDYTVTKKEFEDVRKSQEQGSQYYSTGDDDMLIFELAIQKVFDEFAARDFQLVNQPWEFESSSSVRGDINSEDSSIYGGHMTELMYFLTGKKTEFIMNKDNMEKVLNEFNQKTTALGASVSEDVNVKDVNGKKVKLSGPHAYAIKGCDADTVTIVNPWDSSKEIVLSRETFLENFSNISKCDLSSEDVNYIQYPYKVDNEGNKYYRTEETLDFVIYTNLFGDQIDVKYTEQIYDATGALKETAYLDENENKVSSSYWGIKDGVPYLREKVAYFQDGRKSAVIVYDENGDFDSYELRQYDISGNIKETIFVKNKETIENIHKRNLFDYTQFTLDEIDLIAHFSDDNWQIAEEYLSHNPNATYAEIVQEINNQKNHK